MNSKRTVLITGATSGIGNAIAKNLAKLNYSIIALGRSSDKLEKLIKDLRDTDPKVRIDTKVCDLSSLRTVTAACDEIIKEGRSIDLMVLNAGIWNFEFIESKDGIEETLQVNLIAPLLIFSRLLNLIPKNGESKVIFTSSGLHQGVINFGDIEFRNGYSGFRSYRQSKLGSIMITRWLSDRYSNTGVSFYCVHPGMVNTALSRNAGWFSRMFFRLMGKSKEKGAETHMHLISKKNSELRSGEMYARCKVTRATEYSYNMAEANRLLEVLSEYMNRIS